MMIWWICDGQFVVISYFHIYFFLPSHNHGDATRLRCDCRDGQNSWVAFFQQQENNYHLTCSSRATNDSKSHSHSRSVHKMMGPRVYPIKAIQLAILYAFCYPHSLVAAQRIRTWKWIVQAIKSSFGRCMLCATLYDIIAVAYFRQSIISVIKIVQQQNEKWIVCAISVTEQSHSMQF